VANRFISFIFSFNKLLTGLVILLCAAGTNQVLKAIKPNNEINIWFSKSDPALLAYYDFQQQFGNDRVITLAFEDEKGILTPFSLKRIAALTKALEKVDGVQHVRSVINTKDFRRVIEQGVTKVKFTTWFESYPELNIPEDIQKSMLTSPLVVNRLVNAKGTVALIIISLEPIAKSDHKRAAIIDDITNSTSTVFNEGEFHLGGLDIITNGLNQLSRHDFPIFTGAGFMLMFVIIMLMYRSVACLVLCMLTTVCSIWLAFAIYGLLGYTLNIFTVMVPPIVITIGIIAVMHMINGYENVLQVQGSSRERSQSALEKIFYPSLFAALTTIVGFISQLTSESAVLKEFGLLTSIAVGFTFLFSFLFGSILLPLYKTSQRAKSGWAETAIEAMSKHLILKRHYYWVGLFVFLGLSIYGITKIKIDMYPIGYFPNDHKVIRDHEFMTKQWGEYLPVDFILEVKDSGSLKNPGLVKAMIDFDKELSSFKVVKNTFSFLSVLDRFAAVAYKKSVRDIIADPLLAPRFIRQFNTYVGEEQTRFINQGKTQARYIITGPLLSVRELEKNIKMIDALGKRYFDNKAKLSVIGYPALYVQMMNYTFSSMLSSLLFSLPLIFLIMIVMLRKLDLALIALAPNIFPVLVMLGVLGFLHIKLDLATCTVTAIVLGISIDDTIFFLHHFKEEKLSGKTTQLALLQTQRYVGKVIIFSSLVLFAGFAILLLASLKTVFYFGMLTCIAVAVALVGEVVMIPLILNGRK
jgi:uncharacterized protein